MIIKLIQIKNYKIWIAYINFKMILIGNNHNLNTKRKAKVRLV